MSHLTNAPSIIKVEKNESTNKTFNGSNTGCGDYVLSSSDSFTIHARYQEDGLFGYSWPFSVGVKHGSSGDVLSYINNAGNFSDRGFYLNNQYLGSNVVFPIAFVGGSVTVVPQASPNSQVYIFFLVCIFLFSFNFSKGSIPDRT